VLNLVDVDEKALEKIIEGVYSEVYGNIAVETFKILREIKKDNMTTQKKLAKDSHEIFHLYKDILTELKEQNKLLRGSKLIEVRK